MSYPDNLIKETGLVTFIEDDIAWVNTASKLSCSSCQVESTCGNGILEKYLAGKIFISKIENDLHAKVGDQVEIAIPVSSVTRASLLLYTVPLSGLILGALLGNLLFIDESAIIVSSLLGFITGFSISFFNSKKLAGNTRFKPKMIAKVEARQFVEDLGDIKIKNL